MIYVFQKGEQKKLIQEVIKKAGSERKLAEVTGIPKGSIYHLKFEKRNLSHNYAKKLCAFLQIELNELNFIKKLPNNWGQIKGGKNLIKKKIKEGTFDDTVERLKKASSKMMKQWHKEMKEKHPKKYYTWQYERFKKIGKGYQFKLKNKVKVRNLLEQKVGNFLITNFKNVKYEPYINIDGKVYFPDFVYNNTIIEVTEWKHPTREKLQKLMRKIEDYKKKDYIICFFIPNIYRKFYKGIASPIFSALPKLKKFIKASVA